MDRVDSTSELETSNSTAQVDPFDFTRSLFKLCRGEGLHYYRGSPVRVAHDYRSQSIQALSLKRSSVPDVDPPDFAADNDGDDTTVRSIPCTHLLLAAGPWTPSIAMRLGLFVPTPSMSLPIGNLPGHSILLRPKHPLPATACFASISHSTPDEVTITPELFPRPSGLIYVAGENGGVPIVASAADAQQMVQPTLIRKLICASAALSSELEGTEVVRASLCYRPTTPDGAPIISEVLKNVFVAAGAGPWGISLGPGTGKVMAEMMLHGNAISAQIDDLSLERFKTKAK